MKSNFLVCAVFNFLMAAIIGIIVAQISEPIVLVIYCFVLILIGILCVEYYNSDIVELNEKRGVILTLAIISMFINFITGIILLVTVGQIDSQYKKYINENGDVLPKTDKEKQARKIDGLLKIGATMVTISGIMIATSSWDMMNDLVKMGLILFMSILFFVLCKFSEIKIKIKGTTITYWVLSMIFLILTFVNIGYSELFGDWFSFYGQGNMIYLAFIGLLIAVLSYSTYKMYNIRTFLITSFAGLALSIISIIIFFNVSITIMSLLITVVLVIGNIIKPESAFNKFCFISSFIWAFIVFFIMKDISTIWLVAALLLLNIFNLLYIAFKKSNIGITIISVLFSFIYINYFIEEIWGSIPVWVYLLVSGLGLIGFVTIKELKKENVNK